ncbi:MAG: very short patch repair endonuclease [Chloroflexi bacterium]|nr:very short patch repair endonuclease [Chloroflexota bacterium]
MSETPTPIAPKPPPPSPARSANMARIGSADTTPELAVRQLLHRLGYRFRLHRRSLPGTPDICFPRRKKAIFVHGCFWHRHEGCRRTTMPETRASFWQDKFQKNVARDRANLRDLGQLGWSVMVIWECETTNLEILAARLTGFLDRTAPRSADGNGLQ